MPRPALPGLASPSHAKPRLATPAAPRLAVPRPAMPRRARPAVPRRAEPSPAAPGQASPCHACLAQPCRAAPRLPGLPCSRALASASRRRASRRRASRHLPNFSEHAHQILNGAVLLLHKRKFRKRLIQQALPHVRIVQHVRYRPIPGATAISPQRNIRPHRPRWCLRQKHDMHTDQLSRLPEPVGPRRPRIVPTKRLVQRAPLRSRRRNHRSR